MSSGVGSTAFSRFGRVSFAAGSMFFIAGCAAWLTITKQLRDEKITVPGNAQFFSGKKVQDPLTAYAQSMVIKSNAERGAGGRTFADISEELQSIDSGSEEARKLKGQSAALATAASLRTALMMSVLAYGLSAFAMGIGAVLLVASFDLRRLRR